MRMVEVKLSSKNQVVIPREAREALQLSAGARLRVVVRDDMVILLPSATSYAEAIAGLSRDLYSVDYVATERQSWS